MRNLFQDCTPSQFSRLLHGVSAMDRDVWWNEVLALTEVPEDGAELPRGCVPYMPAPVDALVRLVEHAPVTKEDVFVDVGCGVGRAALFVHLLSGAPSVGVDVQSQLVTIARDNTRRIGLTAVEFLVADACERLPEGTVYFLYCPFGSERVKGFMQTLRALGIERRVTIACLDMVLPACDWLVQTHVWPDLRLYQSVTKHSGHVRSMEPVPEA